MIRVLAAIALWLAVQPVSAVGETFQTAETSPSRPNIVLILADDMGYTDLGCYGGEIETPALDRLAAGGVRFSQFYNTSRCCPTRAALLTGLYSHQAGVGLMMSDLGHEAYRGNFNDRCVTLAEALRPAGYRNYMSGKWHVTRHMAPDAPNHNWPLQRGFDRFYGTIHGAGSYYDPTTLCRGNGFITPQNDSDYQTESFYYTDAISDNAVAWLDGHFADHQSQPFFLYVSYTSPHWPMHALAPEIEKYSGRYDQGYEPIRRQRYAGAVARGLIDPRWRMSPAAINWVDVEHKAWEIRCMEVYAAMVDRMDQGIGRIVDAVHRHQVLDNTLVIYLQDNGGCAESWGRESNAEEIADQTFPPLGVDDLQSRIWPPMQTRDGRPVRTGPDALPGADDTYVSYGEGWANVSNTPFQGYKHDSLEGGISTPFIVHWPACIPPPRRGSIVHEPAHLIDIMPTLLQAAGAGYPAQFNGRTIQPPEGISLLPALCGCSLFRCAPLCFEHHGDLALRDGDWKIVSRWEEDRSRTWQLYHMPTDRTELTDLSESCPVKKAELIYKWQAWADRVGVVEWPFDTPEPEGGSRGFGDGF